MKGLITLMTITLSFSSAMASNSALIKAEGCNYLVTEKVIPHQLFTSCTSVITNSNDVDQSGDFYFLTLNINDFAGGNKNSENSSIICTKLKASQTKSWKCSGAEG